MHGPRRLLGGGTPRKSSFVSSPEGFRREATVRDLCRREGIEPHSYYSWTKEFMEAGQGAGLPATAWREGC